MTFGLGVAAALAGPLVMTIGFIAWDNHWKGSAFSLNLFKCNVASLGFLVLACTTRGGSTSRPFPRHVFTADAVGYMFLSSTIGIVIGDWTWLEALQLLGARRVILMDSLKPFLGAFLGWLILDEELQPAALGGIVLTMAGVLLVSLETTQDGNNVNDNDNDDENKQSNNDDNDDEIDQPVDTAKELEEGSVSISISNKHSGTKPVDDPPTSRPEELENNNGQSLEYSDNVSISQAAAVVATDTASPEPIGVLETAKILSNNNNDDDDEDEPGGAMDANDKKNDIKSKRNLKRGYPYAILNVALDTYGAVLIKEHGKAFKVWEINLLRFGFAGIVMLVVSIVMTLWNYHYQHDTTRSSRQITKKKDEKGEEEEEEETTTQSSSSSSTAWYALPFSEMTKSSWLHVLFGVLLVTFATPSLTNYALFQIALALALTLGSIGPLYSIPLTYLLQHEPPTVRTIAGAILAVAGVVVLSWKGTLEDEEP